MNKKEITRREYMLQNYYDGLHRWVTVYTSDDLGAVLNVKRQRMRDMLFLPEAVQEVAYRNTRIVLVTEITTTTEEVYI